MKLGKLIKIGMLSVSLITSLLVMSSEKYNVGINSVKSKIVSLSLTETVDKEVVYFKDFNGEVLFSENLKESSNYTKVFNLSTLPNGIYFVESATENRVLSTQIVVSDDGVNLVNKSIDTYTTPKISLNENHFEVSIANNITPESYMLHKK